MPSRGSPIVKPKPNVENANGIMSDAEAEQAHITEASADRKPDRARPGFSSGATQTGVRY